MWDYCELYRMVNNQCVLIKIERFCTFIFEFWLNTKSSIVVDTVAYKISVIDNVNYY